MRALRLDYVATSRAASIGTVVLCVGVVLLTVALLEYRAVRQEVSAQEARTAEVRKSGKRIASSVPQSPRDLEARAQEFRLAQLALQRLALRWDELFVALESTGAKDVALLAIEPDPGKSMVKVTAEARTAEDMLRYLERLQSASALADVRLASHQLKATDPLQPLRFVVVASWIK